MIIKLRGLSSLRRTSTPSRRTALYDIRAMGQGVRRIVVWSLIPWIGRSWRAGRPNTQSSKVRPPSHFTWCARLALSPNGFFLISLSFSSQTLVRGVRTFSPSAAACTASSLEVAVVRAADRMRGAQVNDPKADW
ncbi:hypothetical protein K438DRAFT_1755083 [Mycena galopus ATCC 62051]|nr:hypothetical protein K438DRAFT_1755083 [Mycena galopus ATCC 62051]